ncbi:MAG: carbonic anhydrase, partial [Chitinophagales bacterium]
MTKANQENLSPAEALEILKKGNEKFSQSLGYSSELKQQLEDTAKGQAPFAIVLGCIDSRVPCEIIFDQGIGDIFTCRVAGNIVNEDVL